MQHTAQFSLNLAFVVNRLPLWFLVFALFLPRIAMAVAWLQGVLVPFHLNGIIPPLFWLFLPRILVLYLIYVDQGLTLWFLVGSSGCAAGMGRWGSPDTAERPTRILAFAYAADDAAVTARYP